MFENICVFCNFALDVLLCQLGQLDLGLFLGIAELGLLFSLLLEGGCDSLVFPSDLMCQAAEEGELGGKGNQNMSEMSKCHVSLQQYKTDISSITDNS